jgi:hypothetical protein
MVKLDERCDMSFGLFCVGLGQNGMDPGYVVVTSMLYFTRRSIVE